MKYIYILFKTIHTSLLVYQSQPLLAWLNIRLFWQIKHEYRRWIPHPTVGPVWPPLWDKCFNTCIHPPLDDPYRQKRVIPQIRDLHGERNSTGWRKWLKIVFIYIFFGEHFMKKHYNEEFLQSKYIFD